jgi:hypothetical protein
MGAMGLAAAGWSMVYTQMPLKAFYRIHYGSIADTKRFGCAGKTTTLYDPGENLHCA